MCWCADLSKSMKKNLNTVCAVKKAENEKLLKIREIEREKSLIFQYQLKLFNCFVQICAL